MSWALPFCSLLLHIHCQSKKTCESLLMSATVGLSSHGGYSCSVTAAWARMSESVLRVNCVHPREAAIDAARSTSFPSACKGELERHGDLSNHDNTIPWLLVAAPATHASEAVHAASSSVWMLGSSSSSSELCPCCINTKGSWVIQVQVSHRGCYICTGLNNFSGCLLVVVVDSSLWKQARCLLRLLGQQPTRAGNRQWTSW